MPSSSTSITSTVNDKPGIHDNNSPHFHPRLEEPPETEANALPDTSDDLPPEIHDVEKGEADPKPLFTGFDPASFPDGGLDAWLAVSGAFCCIGVFQAYYQANQLSEYSPSTVSWIPSLTVFFMFAGGPFWGKVYDSALRFTLSMKHGHSLIVSSHEYYQFILSQGVCSPIGASLIFYPAMSSTGTWFFKRRALAFGIMAAGSSLGGVILPIMVNQIIDRSGFPWAMRSVAFLLLGLLLYANLTVRSRLPPSPKPWSFMEFVYPFRDPPFSLVVFASFLFFFGMFLPFTFIILSAEHDGMSRRMADYLIPILNAGTYSPLYTAFYTAPPCRSLAVEQDF
ncbi:MAG: hypothetical protein LQ341_003191 [Variospora aurantia]|nr:MAG: hypothetical protein LQ341_003191 [Variospora aurantia]